MTLPIKVGVKSYEEPGSFASRVALGNDFSSLDQFLKAARINPKSLTIGDPGALEKLAYWSGIPSDTLQASLHPCSSGFEVWNIGKASFAREQRTASTFRFCCKCVCDDLATGEGPIMTRPYVRCSWMTQAVRNCTIHQLPLVELPSSRVVDRDAAREFALNLDQIEARAAENAPPVSNELDRYVEGQIRGEVTGSYLERYPTHLAWSFCGYLGRFVTTYGLELFALPSHLDKQSPAEIGFWIAQQGEEAIRSCVTMIFRHGQVPSGRKAPFGDIGRWLYSNRDKLEYAELIDLFRNIAVKNLPVGPEDNCLGASSQRFTHSVLTAAKEYGLTEDRVFELVRQADLLEGPTREYRYTCFDSTKAHDILLAASETITSKELQDSLGLQQSTVYKLFEMGLIKRVETRNNGRVFSRIPRAELMRFKDALFQRTKVIEQPAGYLPLNAICHKVGVGQAQLIADIVDGRIQDVAVFSPQERDVTRLLMNIKEACALYASSGSSDGDKEADGGSNLMTVNEAARFLRATNITISGLARQGFIETVLDRNRTCIRRQMFYTQASIEKFIKSHISIADLAAINSTHPKIMTQLLFERGIPQVNVRQNGETRFFRRDQVSDFFES
ncbi:hypothetical protein E0H65_08205 [Rhizobium leguminosarum bv. viciae]|nr:hypothetical protein E0H65_08205 [Rhizobium leguminosarum bv. viciae]